MACGGQTVAVELRCTGNTPDDYRLDADFGLHGFILDETPQGGGTCSPLSIRFVFFWPIQGADCDGATTIVFSQ